MAAENFQNTLVYAEEWTEKFQQELDEPVKWEKICNVEYTNDRVLHNPYLTDMTVQTGVRGCSYAPQAITLTDDSITISTFRIAPQFIDRADLAQSTFYKQMEAAQRQGILLKEAIETSLYGTHASFTDFDNASIGGSAGSITVSVTNVDNIIRGVKREIREANGESLYNRNGGFIVWRPADLEKLEEFAQANGFATADAALKAGSAQGWDYMGLTHYSSNQLLAGRIVAGVNKSIHIGILRDTWGEVVINDKDPGLVSGIGITTRADYAVKVWQKMAAVCFDIAVV